MSRANASGATLSDQEKNPFAEFLQKEYNNVTQAQFKTTELISEYIKHYITIVTIPFSAVVILININQIQDLIQGPGARIVILFTSILFWVISIIGLMFLWYIFNLRWDALLYARTVNGIRKYFFDQERKMDFPNKYRMRVLPQSPFFPVYREFTFFGPVVLFFAVVNTVYFYMAAVSWQFVTGNHNPFANDFTLSSSTLYFTFHVFLYLYLAQRREFSSLQSHVIGVDVDGVLDLQREQFCAYLKHHTQKEVHPDQITRIPARDCRELGITRQDEHQVFNDPSYWMSMEPQCNAADALKRIRNSMHVKVHIFTTRPWPVQLNCPAAKDTVRIWSKSARKFRADYYRLMPVSWHARLWRQLKDFYADIGDIFPYKIRRVVYVFKTITPIEIITRTWLRKHHFEFDNLMVEMGSEEVADPSAHVHNRFYASRMLPIKYFIEDDLIKAEKLAYICDVIFLIDQPYNQKENLVGNIIRVKDWSEIIQHMREFS